MTVSTHAGGTGAGTATAPVRRPARRAALAVVSTVLLAAASVAPAAALPGTVADGTSVLCSTLGSDLRDQTVTGDLVVDGHCNVILSTVLGSVHVLAEGSLLAERSSLRGALDVAGEAGVVRSAVRGATTVSPTGDLHVVSGTLKQDLTIAGAATLGRSSVHGQVVLVDDVARVIVNDSTVRRSIRGSGYRVELEGSTVEGAVNVATWSDVQILGSTVGGWVNLHSDSVALGDSALARGLTTAGATWLGMCSTTIAADMTVTGIHRRVELESPADLCTRWPGAPPSTIGGSLVLRDNPHTITLRALTVAGDLACTGNTGPGGITVAADVTVAGARTGQCA